MPLTMILNNFCYASKSTYILARSIDLYCPWDTRPSFFRFWQTCITKVVQKQQQNAGLGFPYLVHIFLTIRLKEKKIYSLHYFYFLKVPTYLITYTTLKLYSRNIVLRKKN